MLPLYRLLSRQLGPVSNEKAYILISRYIKIRIFSSTYLCMEYYKIFLNIRTLILKILKKCCTKKIKIYAYIDTKSIRDKKLKLGNMGVGGIGPLKMF